MDKIYFDNCATTPLCAEAKDAMCAAMSFYGNPSSLHTMGVEAEKLVSDARRTILTSLGVRGINKLTEKQLIFTASGTEADNLAMFGTIGAKGYNSKKIIISDSEHPAIMAPAEELEKDGFTVVRIPTVGGEPDYDMIAHEADKSTVLVSFMLVNNETGAIYDIKRISDIVKAANPDALVHTDCVQGYMNIPFTERSLGADMITLSAHKIGGPKGVGALFVSADMLKRRQIAPIIYGGGQESGMRSGTENLLGIVGFGAAVKSVSLMHTAYAKNKATLREYIIERLSDESRFGGVKLNLPKVAAPHVISITLPNIKSETMLHRLSLDGIYVSSGSACSSNTGHKSHVLRAFGLTEREADCTIRVSLGAQNTLDEVEKFLASLENALGTLVRI
ncbi:MAG: cysteine desulfurase [Clostridia bacterium]|nr:cysteine desulfurase [Clostridia bacterium]